MLTFEYWVQWNIIDRLFRVIPFPPISIRAVLILPLCLKYFSIQSIKCTSIFVFSILQCYFDIIIICIFIDIFNKSYHHLWQQFFVFWDPIWLCPCPCVPRTSVCMSALFFVFFSLFLLLFMLFFFLFFCCNVLFFCSCISFYSLS